MFENFQIEKRRRYTGVFISILLFFCLVFIPFQVADAESSSAEYKLKAALLYKLTNFVVWPDYDALKNQFFICVLGKDKFGKALDVLEEHNVSGLPVTVRRLRQSEAINEQCDLVFISESKQPFYKKIFYRLSDRPVLTIGDSEQFAQEGGMIQFTHGDKRIGFKINIQVVKSAGLKISAPLLQLSTIVSTQSKGDY
jgi:hypothetical protein